MIDLSAIFPDAPRRGGWKLAVLAGVLLLAGGYLLWCWYAPAPAVTTAGFVPGQPAHEVAKVPTVPVKVDVPLQVVPKPVASGKLKLPPAVAGDAGKQVVSTAEVPPTRGGATTVTVLDTRTGAFDTLVREKARPLFGFERGTEIGARYGVSTDGGQQAAVYVRRDLLRVGSVYLAGYGEAKFDTLGDSEARAMIDVSMRW